MHNSGSWVALGGCDTATCQATAAGLGRVGMIFFLVGSKTGTGNHVRREAEAKRLSWVLGFPYTCRMDPFMSRAGQGVSNDENMKIATICSLN